MSYRLTLTTSLGHQLVSLHPTRAAAEKAKARALQNTRVTVAAVAPATPKGR